MYVYVHVCCTTYVHTYVDKRNLDGKFLIKYEVEVKEEELQMIEENFKRAYWPWELPKAYRKQITVST